MSGPQLTTGAIKHIYDTGQTDSQPTLQVWDVKQIGKAAEAGKAERFRIVISDGVHYQQAMLATQQNEKVKNGSLAQNCCIVLKQYICNVVQNKKIIIALELDVACPPLPGRIGNATNVDQSGQAAPVQQPSAQEQRPAGFAQPEQPQAVAQPVQQSTFNNSRPAYSRPVQRTPVSDKNVRPIEALNPYTSNWTIKAMVDGKGDMKTWNNAKGSGNLFSVTLKDMTGSIRATAFKEDADRLYKDLVVGQTYLVKGGQFKPANARYNDTGHQYEITFGRETQVVPVSSGDLKIQYKFVKLNQLESTEPNTLVDICGVAADVGEVTEVIARKDQRTLKKRNITIVDDSNSSVECTLWGKTAENFARDAPGAPASVVVLRKAKVSDWNGRSISFTGETSIQKNVDMAEVHQIRGWWDNGGNAMQGVKNLSANTGGAGAGQAQRGPNTENRKSFAKAKSDGIDKTAARPVAIFNNLATITHIKTVDAVIAYPSCPETKRKMVEIGDNTWKCESTGKEYPEPVWRYCLQLRANDHTGNYWITAFDDTATTLLGKEAKEVQGLKAKMDTDKDAEGKFFSIIENVIGKDFVFRIASKEDMYKDEMRMKHSVLGLDKINYADESKLILNRLADQFGITA